MMNDEEKKEERKSGRAEERRKAEEKKRRREEKTRFSQLHRFLTSSLPVFSWAVFVLNFELLNFEFVSNFVLRASNLLSYWFSRRS